jgi:hypothetical protein
MTLDDYNRLSGKVLPALPDVQKRRIGDKYSKLKAALSAALVDPEARWIMFVDADDLIHRNVVSYALEHDGEFPGGHTVTSGYSWRFGDDFFRTVDGFHNLCGSCNAIRLSDEEKETYAKTGDLHVFDRATHWLFAGHASVHTRLNNAGRTTGKFPFRAAVYVTGTGFNYSGVTRVGGTRVEVSPEIRLAFGL